MVDTNHILHIPVFFNGLYSVVVCVCVCVCVMGLSSGAQLEKA